MKISAEDRDKILDELEEEFGAGEIEPDEITCKMLAQRLGITPKMANALLNKKVEEGSYSARWVRSQKSNNREKAYRKIKDEQNH